MKDRRKNKTKRNMLLAGYLCCCLFIVVFAYAHLSRIARDYNTQHMELITGLYAEKINSAMEYINNYVTEEAELMEIMENANPQDIMGSLQERMNHMDFANRGLVMKNGEVLGSPGAVTDIRKRNLDTQALESEVSFISDPYQSSETGSMILTVFVPLDSQQVASLYVSVDMEDIRRLASSELLQGKVDVHLLKADSENYITCISTKREKADNWNNLLLQQKYFRYRKGYSYHQWITDMQSGKESGELAATIRGVDSTISYQSIPSMQGWYVVVSLANEDVADITRQFSEWGGIYGAILVGLTVWYMMTIVILEKRDKKIYMGLSATDALTGILNRTAFQQKVEEQLRSNVPGVLVFLDVDDFKKCNDLYGHQNGDLCLIHFANTMCSSFPEDAIVGRYGGDEFVVYFRNVGIESAKRYMDAFQKNVARLHLPTGEDVTLTTSAGGALYPDQGEDYISLCRYADIMLYDVKRSGKADFKLEIKQED